MLKKTAMYCLMAMCFIRISFASDSDDSNDFPLNASLPHQVQAPVVPVAPAQQPSAAPAQPVVQAPVPVPVPFQVPPAAQPVVQAPALRVPILVQNIPIQLPPQLQWQMQLNELSARCLRIFGEAVQPVFNNAFLARRLGVINECITDVSRILSQDAELVAVIEAMSNNSAYHERLLLVRRILLRDGVSELTMYTLGVIAIADITRNFLLAHEIGVINDSDISTFYPIVVAPFSQELVCHAFASCNRALDTTGIPVVDIFALLHTRHFNFNGPQAVYPEHPHQFAEIAVLGPDRTLPGVNKILITVEFKNVNGTRVPLTDGAAIPAPAPQTSFAARLQFFQARVQNPNQQPPQLP